MGVTLPTYNSSAPLPAQARLQPDPHERSFANGYLFNVPVRDFGWFASLLIGFATGFVAFFAATFVGIVSIMIYNASGHHAADYSWSYKRFGLPVGLLCAVLVLGYMAMLWAKRKTRR